jgi:hypothetical protein
MNKEHLIVLKICLKFLLSTYQHVLAKSKERSKEIVKNKGKNVFGESY